MFPARPCSKGRGLCLFVATGCYEIALFLKEVVSSLKPLFLASACIEFVEKLLRIGVIIKVIIETRKEFKHCIRSVLHQDDNTTLCTGYSYVKLSKHVQRNRSLGLNFPTSSIQIKGYYNVIKFQPL